MSSNKILKDAIVAGLSAEEPFDFELSTEKFLEEFEQRSETIESLQRLMTDICELETQRMAGVSIESLNDMLVERLKQDGTTYADFGVDGTDLSMEGFGTRIRHLIDAISRVFWKFLDYIVGFFDYLFGDITQIQSLLQDTRLRLSGKKGAYPTKSVVGLGALAPFLSTEKIVPRNNRHIESAMGELTSQLAVMQTYYATPVVGLGASLQKAIEKVPLDDLSGETTKQVLDELNTAFDAVKLSAISSRITTVTPFTDHRFPKGATFVGSPLIGMRSLVFVFGDKLNPEQYNSSDPVAKSYAIQANRVFLARTSPNRRAKGEGVYLEAMTPQAIEAFLKTIETLLGAVSTASRSNLKRKLRSGARDAQKSIVRLKNVRSGNTNNLIPFVNYCNTYVNWAKSPFVQMMALSLTVCRSAVVYARKHVANL